MQEEIAHARNLGADGIVLGCWISKAAWMSPAPSSWSNSQHLYPSLFTGHRHDTDLPTALEDVVATGATRILTSGGAPTVMRACRDRRHGRSCTGSHCHYAGRGITADNIASIAHSTGQASSIPALARLPKPGSLSQAGMAMGDLRDREYRRFTVREESVRALIHPWPRWQRNPRPFKQIRGSSFLCRQRRSTR